MTGFGNEIYRRGEKRGETKGKILGALMCGKSPEQVAEMLKVPVDEVLEVREKEAELK